jgi:hypothetical protein
MILPHFLERGAKILVRCCSDFYEFTVIAILREQKLPLGFNLVCLALSSSYPERSLEFSEIRFRRGDGLCS